MERATWSVGIAVPLYKRSPKEWPVLFTILKQVQKINCIVVGEGKRTSATLDGDLYDHVVKLKDYERDLVYQARGVAYYDSKFKVIRKVY